MILVFENKLGVISEIECNSNTLFTSSFTFTKVSSFNCKILHHIRCATPTLNSRVKYLIGYIISI